MKDSEIVDRLIQMLSVYGSGQKYDGDGLLDFIRKNREKE